MWFNLHKIERSKWSEENTQKVPFREVDINFHLHFQPVIFLGIFFFAVGFGKRREKINPKKFYVKN
jgi:hypothetical protein